MTLKYLILNSTWTNISSLFLEIYPEAEKNLKGYENVFEKLLLIDPEHMDMSIVTTKVKDGEDVYIDVSGLHNHPKNEEENYLQGLELTPWRKWLGMDISKDSLNEFSELELIVHCLYEMTFVGFDEDDIERRISSIEKSRKKSETMTEEESNAITASVEEILRSWREENND